jgi:menaquinone-9 beta-reductase
LNESRFEVCIVGAGPAGTSAALQLAKAGIRCALIDKSAFPREKICGDGISGRSLEALKELDPALVNKLKDLPSACPSWGVRIVAPNNKSADISFRDFNKKEPPGYVVKRKEFDNLLVEKVRNSKFIDFFEKTKISGTETYPDGLKLYSPNNKEEFTCKLLILANGDPTWKQTERSLVSGNLHKYKPGIGIRTYFEGVKGITDDLKIEMHFYKKLLPWYLWVFPISSHSANVGMGMLHDSVKQSGESMKQTFLSLLRNEPQLRERFQKARPVEEIKASRLHYFMGKKQISGNRYMLTGDAAGLTDPFTGEGIGNALLSGILAARTAEKCLAVNDFSQNLTCEYEERLYNKLLKELELGLRIQDRAHSAMLINLVVNKARKSKTVRKTLMKMIYNINHMGELTNPVFYLKLALNL